MQTLSVEFDLRSVCTSAEEVHGAAFTDHVDCPLPCSRTADGLDYNVRATLIWREQANGFDGILNVGDLYNFMRADPFGSSDLSIAFNNRDHVAAGELRGLHE